MTAPIFVISGTPGSGKSSVATSLMQRFEFGLHIPTDDIREWVVSGRADPLPVWTDETTRQFRLMRQATLQLARLYADAGFAVAIDDVLFEGIFKDIYAGKFSGYQVYKVLLSPSLEQALARNAVRTNKPFDTSVLVNSITVLHRELLAQNRPEDGWLIIDSTNLTLTETVDAILNHVKK